MVIEFFKKVFQKIKSEVNNSDQSQYSEIAISESYSPSTVISNSLTLALGLSLAGSLVVSFLSSYYFIINLL